MRGAVKAVNCETFHLLWLELAVQFADLTHIALSF